VFQGEVLLAAVPVVRLSHAIVFGRCTVSHGAVNLLLREHVPVLFLTQSGRYCGRLASERMADLDRLVLQVDRSRDDVWSLAIARVLVAGKLRNGRVLLQRLNRSRRCAAVKGAIAELSGWIDRAGAAATLPGLLGCEGSGSKVYFRGLGACVRSPFEFNARTKRPPTDPVNALLSLGYTLLHQHVFSLVQAAGLHPHFGSLHVPSVRHAALVSDLVEEFRAPIVDSLVLTLVNHDYLSPKDFAPPDGCGAVLLRPPGLKVFLKHWQARLNSRVIHPTLKERTTYLRVLELQVWEYLAVLSGEQTTYRPFRFQK
jgi:CRISPR-associated protein Cas1